MKPQLLLTLALLVGGLTLCGAGLWLLLSPPRYAATVKIRVESVAEILGHSDYNPYFVQSTFEIIQSELVLSNAVISLKLDDVWEKKDHHERSLTTAQSIKMIQSHLRVALVHNTSRIAITYNSDTPDEAAGVANAIAESYRDYHTRSLEEPISRGLETLIQQFKDEEGKIRAAQTNVNLLRENYGIQDEASTNHPSEQQPYWDKKQELDQMLKTHQLLWAKIEAKKLDATITRNTVHITDRAQPSEVSIGPNRLLGMILLICGLVMSGLGILTVKKVWTSSFSPASHS